VPAVVVLNGPPAVGKSTIARLYADAHPLTLRIDVDEVRDWLGAWQESPSAAGLRARALATAMTRDHLRARHDVVIAQLYGRPEHLIELEGVATEVGAEYHEIVLMTDLATTLERFTTRGGPRLDDARASPGGLDAIADLHARVEALTGRRAQATVVPSRADDIDATYRAVVDAVGR
jgi:predicted kinase